ncbi:hypothetical protein [Nocardiopsis algeriensis]|uniref:Uncharacterized protein n=1 Tax=Nocardiopsis algeriensis TaxID=1478215 RepID=A0A841ILZ4_9ACTN|nr:hypothetical protein [Nocardiopsis algeriensis]MBB6119673.1 hypothetical protein [Nocardiopsis algeriensis]
MDRPGDRGDREEEEGEGKRIELSASQVVGAGAATLAAATAASWLNVYGTVVGAAVMAALSTLASPFLQHWFSRGGQQARQLAERRAPRTGEPAASAESSAVRTASPPKTRKKGGARRGWRSLAVSAAAVFVLAMLVILLFELFTGRSLTSWTRGTGEPTAPTLLGGTSSGPAAGEEAPAEEAPAEEAPEDPPAGIPGQQPGEVPAPEGEAEPTEPSPDAPEGTEAPGSEPTDAPGTAPAPDPPAQEQPPGQLLEPDPAPGAGDQGAGGGSGALVPDTAPPAG